MLGIWPWEPWYSLFCLYSFNLSASIFLFSNGIIPYSLCLFARYFCPKIFIFFCYLNSYKSRPNSLPMFSICTWITLLLFAHIFFCLCQRACAEVNRDRSNTLMVERLSDMQMWPWSSLRGRGSHKSSDYAMETLLILLQHRCEIQPRFFFSWALKSFSITSAQHICTTCSRNTTGLFE